MKPTVLRRRDFVLLAIAAGGLVVKRRSSVAEPWSVTDEEAFATELTLESVTADEVAGLVHGALSRLRGRISMDSWKRPVPVLIPSFLSPGLVVDLGDRPLPAAVRTSLARHRLDTCFGCTAVDWQIALDEFAVIGQAAAFAVRHTLVATVLDGLGLGERAVQLQPELVWAANAYCNELDAGWLIVDREGECDVASISDGVLRSIDVRLPSVAMDWTDVVSRLCLLRGVEAQTEPIHVLSSLMRQPKGSARMTDAARAQRHAPDLEASERTSNQASRARSS